MGPFRHDIVITADLKDAPVIKVLVRGIYSPPVFFEKSAIMVGDVLHGEIKNIEVPLYVAEGRGLERIAFVIPEGAPIEAKAVRAASGQSIARIHWGGNAPPGLHRYDVRVKMDDEIAYAPQQGLTFTIQVLPLVDSSPPSFYVRDSEVFSKWWRRADIHVNAAAHESTDAGEGWLLSWSDPRFAEALLVNLSTLDKRTASIRLSSARPERVKALAGQRATLEVRARQGYTAQLHVYIGRGSLFPAIAYSKRVFEVENPYGWVASTFNMACPSLRPSMFHYCL